MFRNRCLKNITPSKAEGLYWDVERKKLKTEGRTCIASQDQDLKSKLLMILNCSLGGHRGAGTNSILQELFSGMTEEKKYRPLYDHELIEG